MAIYFLLAWRNLLRHRRRTFIVVVAIGISLMMMMMYDGLVAGFNQAIYGNAIKVLGGNIQVHADGYQAKAGQIPLIPLQNDQLVVTSALAQPQVLAAARRINTGGMISNNKGAYGVTIVGVEPEKELPVSLVAQHVASGRYLTSDDQDVVFIGKGLADAMEAQVGDRITLAGRATHNQMRNRTMTIAGIYNLGMGDIEKQTVYISLLEAQNLYGLDGQVTEVALTLKQIGEEGIVVKALKLLLPGDELITWQQNFPELESVLATKGQVMNVFSTIILVIAGIGILNLLLMAIYERTREIGILGAFGMKPRQISYLFLLEGGLTGLIGVFFGTTLGLALNFWLNKVGMDYSQFTGLTSFTALITTRVYSSLGFENWLPHVFTVLVISILAAYYPAHEAAQREPAEALHYV